MDAKVKGQIDPSLFDQGIPAFILNYGISGARTWYENGSYQDDQFISLRIKVYR